MKKILTVCVSVLLSLSFLVPIMSLSAFNVSAESSNICDVYDGLSEARKARLASVLDVSSINFVIVDQSGWFYYGSNIELSGSLEAAKPYGSSLTYVAPDGTQNSYTNMMQYMSFDLSNSTVFKYVHYNGTRLIPDYTFNSSACVVNYFVVSLEASAGGSVSGAGSYKGGSVATLTATADEGYRFKQWSDGVTNNPRSLTVNSDISLTAEFELIPYFDISLNVLGNGQVFGAGTYQGGSVVQIEAVPGSHYSFSKWSDGNSDNPRNITLNSDITLTAIFVEDPKYTVTVEIFGEGVVNGTGEFYGGTEIMLSAIPDEGYYFSSWNDGSIDPAKILIVDQDITLAANFKKKSTAACSYSKDLIANPYVLKGVERATNLVETNEIEDYWKIYKRMYNFYQEFDGYVPNTIAFVQPQSIEYVLAYVLNDEWIYDSLGFEVNVPGYYSWQYAYNEGDIAYSTLRLSPGQNVGGSREDASGNVGSFTLVSRYDDVTILDNQCWAEGYDSNYYDLLQYYEMKNVNSNLVTNNNELFSINTVLNAISTVSSNIFNKLSDAALTLLGIESAVQGTNDLLNEQIGLDQHQNDLIESGNTTSQAVTNVNDSVNSELTSSIDQHNQIELEYQQQMSNAMNNIDFNVDLGNVSNFTSTAAFISGQMDQFFNLNPSIKMLLTFPMICGLAMLIIGRLKK